MTTIDPRTYSLRRLGLALGLKYQDGSPVVLDAPGTKCPSVNRIKQAILFSEKRLSKDRVQDAYDDDSDDLSGKGYSRYAATFEASPEVKAVLASKSGVDDWTVLQVLQGHL